MTAPAPYAGLAGVYDEVVAGVDYAAWSAFCLDAWRDDPLPVRRVLDVCCGTGLMTAELVAAGLDVVGVDASAPMLARARELLGPDVRLSVQVLPDLLVDGVFDAAVSSFDSLNYLQPSALPGALRSVAAHLRPGGHFVFDVHTDRMMRTIAADPVSDAVSDGVRFRMVSTVDLDERRSDTRVEVTAPDGTRFAEDHRQFFPTDDTLRAALAAGGLEVVAVTDDYADAPVGDDTLRATWVTRRPS